MALPNYVKFLRGTVASYNRLAVKDENTLYFVYQDGDDTKGRLYLGNRLISGDIGGEGVNTLAELTDVIITGADAGSFLVLNSDGKWVATSASDVAQTILEAGGNFISIDENEFQFNPTSGKLELNGYSNAANSTMLVKTNEGISWQNVPNDYSSEISTLESKVAVLETDFQTVDDKINTAIANTTHLTYQVIDNLNKATKDNTIYLYLNDLDDTSNKYNEFMLVDGQLEQIGSLDIDLSNYVTTDYLNTKLTDKVDTITFDTTTQNITSDIETINTTLEGLDDIYVTKNQFTITVGDLTSLNQYNNLGTTASIADNLEDIYSRLIWQEIHE